MNQILTLAPYKLGGRFGQWVFDDPTVGLRQEAFIAGIDKILDRLTADNPQAHKGFRLLFSPGPFPGSQIRLDWVREEHGGNWYVCKAYQIEGWLCPALYKYFTTAPRTFHAQALPL